VDDDRTSSDDQTTKKKKKKKKKEGEWTKEEITSVMCDVGHRPSYDQVRKVKRFACSN